MNIEEFRALCLSLPFVTEEFPFDETTLVFKVKGKMFALTSLEKEFSINIKCDPDEAILLRERFAAVTPGYHMSKKHWNTVVVDGSVPKKFLQQWINDSYRLVVKSLPKKDQKDILELNS